MSRSTNPKDVDGIIRTPGGAGKVRGLLERGAEQSAALKAEAEAARPLPIPDLPPVRSLELAMLPEVLKPWVEDLCERLQAPPEFVAVPAIVAAGSVLGNRVGLRPKVRDSWTEYPNLWGCVVGRPSTMKSPAITAALSPLYKLQTAATEVYQAQRQNFEQGKAASAIRRKAAAEEALKAARGGKKFDEASLVEEAEEVHLRRYVANSATFAALHKLLQANPTGSLLFCDELAGLLAQLRNPETGGELRAFLLAAWSGAAPFILDRIERGVIVVPRCCLSVLGGIQPGKLARLVKAAVEESFDDDGFLQRFGLLVWPDVPKTWTLIDRPPDKAAGTAVFDAFSFLENAPKGVFGEETEDGERFLRFEAAAAGAFADWLTGLSGRLRSGDLVPALEAHLSKHRKLVPGLSLIFHLLDDPGGPVSLVALNRALEWAAVLETHARRLYGAGAHPGAAEARLILARIRKGDLKAPFSSRDVWRPGWSGLGDAKAAGAGLGLLVELGWLNVEVTQTGGRPSQTFTLTPNATP